MSEQQDYKDRLSQAVINQFERDIEAQDYTAIDELIILLQEHGGGRWLHGYIGEDLAEKFNIVKPENNTIQGIRNLIGRELQELKTVSNVLFTDEDITDEDGNDNDTIYDYPSCSYVDKYGFYISGVVRELLGNGKFIMHKTGEYDGNEIIEVELAELTTDEILGIIDFIQYEFLTNNYKL